MHVHARSVCVVDLATCTVGLCSLLSYRDDPSSTLAAFFLPYYVLYNDVTIYFGFDLIIIDDVWHSIVSVWSETLCIIRPICKFKPMIKCRKMREGELCEYRL